GHVAHGTAGVSPMNFATMMAFLAWFGGTGYLLTSEFRWLTIPALTVAILGGLSGAAVMFWVMSRVLWAPRDNMQSVAYQMVGLLVLCVALLTSFLASLYRKAGPHEAVIVYGFRGTRVVKGPGTIILPMIEASRQLSLELMSFDVAPTQDLYTKQGVAVTVEAVAQIKVKSDPVSIQTASEQFLTKSPDQREGLIRLVMEGHLRGIIGQLTVEEIA